MRSTRALAALRLLPAAPPGRGEMTREMGPRWPEIGCRLRHLSAARNPLDFDSLGRTLEAGAFPALRSLYFTAWHIPAGEEGSAEEAAGRLALKAACEARGVTCHCALLED